MPDAPRRAIALARFEAQTLDDLAATLAEAEKNIERGGYLVLSLDRHFAGSESSEHAAIVAMAVAGANEALTRAREKLAALRAHRAEIGQ